MYGAPATITPARFGYVDLERNYQRDCSLSAKREGGLQMKNAIMRSWFVKLQLSLIPLLPTAFLRCHNELLVLGVISPCVHFKTSCYVFKALLLCEALLHCFSLVVSGVSGLFMELRRSLFQ